MQYIGSILLNLIPKLNWGDLSFSVNKLKVNRTLHYKTNTQIHNPTIPKFCVTCKSDGHKWNKTMLVAVNLTAQTLGREHYGDFTSKVDVTTRVEAVRTNNEFLRSFLLPKTTQVSANIYVVPQIHNLLGLRSCCCDSTLIWPFSKFAPKRSLKRNKCQHTNICSVDFPIVFENGKSILFDKPFPL